MDDARRDWGVEEVELFAANLDTTVEKKVLVERIRENSSQARRRETREGRQGRRFHPGLGPAGTAGGAGAINLGAMDSRKIKNGIDAGFRKLNVLTAVAFSSLLVATLGVANAVMASVRQPTLAVRHLARHRRHPRPTPSAGAGRGADAGGGRGPV